VHRNGPGTEIVFTLYRLPDLSDAAFGDDARRVADDLHRLKVLLEHGVTAASTTK
jgi:hypothetical protein